MNNKIIRYIVENGEQIKTSYSTSFGKNALTWAVMNASRYGGKIMAENADGSITLYKSYENK